MQSRTKTIMNQMLDVHKPEYWIFGHYHEKRDKKIENTQFTCCGMISRGVSVQKNIRIATFEMKGLNWSPDFFA